MHFCEITGRDNANVKHASKLVKSSKFRKEENEFVLEGKKLCEEALNSGVKIKKVFCTRRFLIGHGEPGFISSISARGYIISDEAMRRISDVEVPQGILCVCEIPATKVETVDVLKYDKLVVLESVQNPSNLGAIVRTCEALGVGGVIITGRSCDVYSTKVLRGSMGSALRVKACVAEDCREIINLLNNSGFVTLATVPSADADPIYEFKNLKKTALVIGNEGNGLGREVVGLCRYRVTIPTSGSVESLNAAVAAGIAIWETTCEDRRI